MAVKKADCKAKETLAAVGEEKPTGGAGAKASRDPEVPTVKKAGNGWRSEKQRGLTLEHAKRTVWANLQAIVESAIRQSLDCNYSAAKFLCDFAEVAEMEEPEDSEDKQRKEDADAMEWFFDRLGIKSPDSEEEDGKSAAAPAASPVGAH